MAPAPSPTVAPLPAAVPPALPFVDLKAQQARLRPVLDARIRRVLEHGQYILGPEVGELETSLAAFCGAQHAIAVSSGTDALLVALMAEGVGPGEAVFLPAFTFPATAEVVAAVGATPVFVDVDARTFNIDPDDLERRIGEVEVAGRLRPRAVIAVDLYGAPADYGRLVPIVDRRGMFLLADAAQSFGAALDSHRVGTLAPVTAVSFFPAKPLGCYGDGGALFTDDDDRARVMRSVRVHGEGTSRYDVVRLGRNARLDTLQAAVLLAKLEVFADELERRAAVADLYDRLLADVVTVPARQPGAASAWAQYTVLVEHRDEVKRRLAEKGIPTMVYYPKPLHLQPIFAPFGDGPGSVPTSERLCERVLSLPVHPYLEDATVECIAEAVRAACA